jgi:hypothetical protein
VKYEPDPAWPRIRALIRATVHCRRELEALTAQVAERYAREQIETALSERMEPPR